MMRGAPLSFGHRSVFAVYAAGAAFMLLFSAGLLRGAHTQNLVPSAALSASLCVAGAVLTWQFARRGALPGWCDKVAGALVCLFALSLAALSVGVFKCVGWDEADYLCSGLALRGFSTPFASYRPPFTHLLCAMAGNAPYLINPLLLLVLLAALAWWAKRRRGAFAAASILAVLLCQNLFCQMLLDINSEMPAAVLLVLAFLSLAGGRFTLAGFLFCLATFARWNMGVIPATVALMVLLHAGFRPLLRLAIGGTVPAALWLAVSYAHGIHPFESIYIGNFLPAANWAPVGMPKPDFFARCRFYPAHFFFLTPLGIPAMAACLLVPRSPGGTDGWAIHKVLPVSVLVYCLSTLCVGGLFSRFMAPMVPLFALALVEAAWSLKFSLSTSHAAGFHLALGSVILASVLGTFPDVALASAQQGQVSPGIAMEIKARWQKRVPLPAGFAARAASVLGRKEIVYAPALEPLSHCGGAPLMYQLRRTVRFPDAVASGNGDLIPAQDEKSEVAAALRNTPPHSAFLTPDAVRIDPGVASPLVSDGGFALYRTR